MTDLAATRNAAVSAPPALLAGAGDRAAQRLLEFFTVNIRNRNTRAAYARAALTLIVLAWSSPAFSDEIHDAARFGDLGEVKALLKANPDLAFSRADNGMTPLHSATVSGNWNVAAYLLAHKANVNATDNIGSTPLHLAVVSGNMAMVELLLAHKANINAMGRNNGWTPLHVAAVLGHRGVAELLLAHKANVNATDNEGETPLHLAAHDGYAYVAELLLAWNANVNATDNNGSTPLHLAAINGYTDVVELLRQHGGHE